MREVQSKQKVNKKVVSPYQKAAISNIITTELKLPYKNCVLHT